MRINTNIGALNAYRNLSNTNNAVSDSMSKLSSGFRINRAADDAAGLAIANKLRNDGRTLAQATRNASQANAMLQIADGGAQTVASILDRMKELSAQAASANIGDQRGKLDDEFQALNEEIQRIVDTTQYQGMKMLDGSGGAEVSVKSTSAINDNGTEVAKVTLSGRTEAVKFTIASDKDANGVVTLSWTDGNGDSQTEKVLATDGAQTLNFAKAGITIETALGFVIGDGTDAASFDGADIDVDSTGGGGSALTILVGATGDQAGNDKIDIKLDKLAKLSASLTSLGNAQSAMDSVDALLGTVNDFIGALGAAQSRLDYASKNLAITAQNTAAAESVIRDVDMAEEMTKFSKNNILAQAGTAMLAQANQSSQGILQLLRG